MIYVDVVSVTPITHKPIITTREFPYKESALRFMFMIRNKGYIIDGWRCDDPLDNEWLNHRFKL